MGMNTLALLALLAQVPAPGETQVVACKDDPTQLYACHLPKGYVKTKKWPILYCFSPNANGRGFVDLYREACEEVGWIVVGSNNSKNGPWEPIEAAIQAMWKDTHDRFSLDEKRCFASGFSGGARVSFSMAGMYKDSMAGVIAIGAGLADGKIGPKGMAVWLVCGTTDMNLKELEALDERLKSEGWKYVRKTFEGGHTLPPRELAIESIKWMAKEKPRSTLNPEAARKALEAGEKALREKSTKTAIRFFQSALRQGDEEQQKAAEEKLGELQKAADELWKQAEEATDAAKKKSLYTRISKEYEGLDIAGRAAEELKKIK